MEMMSSTTTGSMTGSMSMATSGTATTSAPGALGTNPVPFSGGAQSASAPSAAATTGAANVNNAAVAGVLGAVGFAIGML